MKKKDFFKPNDMEDLNKSFTINADTELPLLDDRTTMTGIYLKLDINKSGFDLSYSIQILAWSNDEQKNVPLEQSVWSDESFFEGRFLPNLQDYYSKIIQRLITFLDEEIRYYGHLKELIYKLENPILSFHNKLLNSFSQGTLEALYKNNFPNDPILNVDLLDRSLKMKERRLRHILLPNYSNGFYMDGIEVSVDMNDSDYATIEDLENGGEMTVDEFLKQYGL